MNLKLSLIFLVALMNGCASSPTAPTARDHVESGLPSVPGRIAAGQAVPNYAGVWVGTIAGRYCDDIFRESCKSAPPTSDVVRFEFSQNGSDIVFAASGRSGYVSDDLGIVVTYTVDSYVYRLYLRPSGDVLNGRDTFDLVQFNKVIKSEWYDYVNLRRTQ